MAKIITIGNEKGGAGKSTIAVHLAIAALKSGNKVAVLDFDLRQKSFGRFLENRINWAKLRKIDLLIPQIFSLSENIAESEQEEKSRAIIEEANQAADIVIIDTPGANTLPSRIAHGLADIIITPMNDSFVDFDLLAKFDPENGSVSELNFYSHQIWEARKQKAMQHRRHLEWFILRNRLSNFDARNKRRVGDALDTLSKRIGFKIVPGLSERVIYRELFPMGLTLLDLEDRQVGMTMSISHVAARQELREMIATMGLLE